MSYQGDFSFFLLFFCKRTFWTQTAKQVFPWGPLLEFFRSFHSPRHLSKLSWGRWSAVEMLGIAKSLDYNWTTAWSGSDATSWNQFKNAWPLFHTFCYKINKQTNRYGLRGFPHLYEMMEFLINKSETLSFSHIHTRAYTHAITQFLEHRYLWGPEANPKSTS